MDPIWYILTPDHNTIYWTTPEQFENYTAFVKDLNKQFGPKELFSTGNVIYSTEAANDIVNYNDIAESYFIIPSEP